MAEHLSLRRFVAGVPCKSAPNGARIREMLDQLLSIPYDLSIVDVLEAPSSPRSRTSWSHRR
jgi:hypothetical protein